MLEFRFTVDPGSAVTEDFTLEPIGYVQSRLVDRTGAPRQPDEGAPDAWLVFEARIERALRDIRPGDSVIVVTWLHRARRDVLSVHPRGATDRPAQGVFSTRSPDRPNPIGLHEVQIVEVDRLRIRVDAIEAIDGTPIVDVKPVLGPRGCR
jgi:tRNA-Thr(GGU) m(6)t(6)A37 methyltransferase TsaA